MRTGNLSAISNAIYHPITGERIAGNVIPASQINPIAQRVAAIWPLPNMPGLVNNYVENNVQTNDLNAFDVRGDVNFGARGSLFMRFSRADRDFVEPPAGNQFMEGGNASTSGNYNAVVGHTYTMSSSTLNELRVGVNKYHLSQVGSDFGIDKNNELGIPNGNIAGHPVHVGHRRLQHSRVSPHRFAGLHQFGPDRQHRPAIRHAVVAREPALAEVRRRLPAHQLHADESADDAEGPLWLRLAVPRAATARPARAMPLPASCSGIRTRSTATSWTPIPRS